MTYEAALAKVRAASEVFSAAREAYRAREISDADYCAAFAAHKAAQDEFDVAFEAAAEAAEIEVEVADQDDATLDMFA